MAETDTLSPETIKSAVPSVSADPLKSVADDIVRKGVEDRPKLEASRVGAENTVARREADYQQSSARGHEVRGDYLNFLNTTRPPELDLRGIPEPKKPPTTQQESPFQNLLNPMMGLGMLLGGKFGGRNHLTAALKAGRAALDASHKGDEQAVKLAMQDWDNSTKYMQDLMQWRVNSYNAAKDKYKNDADQYLAAINVTAAETGDRAVQLATATGDLRVVEKAIDANNKMLLDFRNADLDRQNRLAIARANNETKLATSSSALEQRYYEEMTTQWLDQHPGEVMPSEVAAGFRRDAKGRNTAANDKVSSAFTKWSSANPGKNWNDFVEDPSTRELLGMNKAEIAERVQTLRNEGALKTAEVRANAPTASMKEWAAYKKEHPEATFTDFQNARGVVSSADKIKIATAAAQQRLEAAKIREYGPPQEVSVDNGEGGTRTVLAQQNKTTGQWATADAERLPLAVKRVLTTSERGSEAVKLTPSAIDFMADQYMSGDRSVFQNLGRGNAGTQNIVALRNAVTKKMESMGLTGRDLAMATAEFGGAMAAMRTLGNRSVQLGMAASEAQQMAPLAIEASQAVDRTEFPALNSVILAAEQGTGDPDVVKFGIAVNSLINIYARAISPTGVPTVNDKEHARELLSTNWSQGQFDAGIGQLMLELKAAGNAPNIVRDDFERAFAVKGQNAGLAVPAAQQWGAYEPDIYKYQRASDDPKIIERAFR